MSKKRRNIELFIVDIFIAIEKIRNYTSSFRSANDLLHSSLHWDATIRQLEIIGEALNKLLVDEKFAKHSPKYFRRVVNFRNNIVHGYFGIDAEEVWNVITLHLNSLQDDIQNIVENNVDISEAIESEIEEYKKLNDVTIVKFLMSLQ